MIFVMVKLHWTSFLGTAFMVCRISEDYFDVFSTGGWSAVPLGPNIFAIATSGELLRSMVSAVMVLRLCSHL